MAGVWQELKTIAFCWQVLHNLDIITSDVLGRGVASHRLVPDDIVVLQPGKAACDMVLLQGNCLVGESILSGEVPGSLLMLWSCT